MSRAPLASHSSAPVQRAVVLLDVNKDDYALHTVLTGLKPGKLELVTTGLGVVNFEGARKADGTLRAMIPYADLSVVANSIRNRREQGKSAGTPVIAADEDVHVVGHGRSDRVWTLPQHGGEITDFTNLGTWLAQATPPDWSGTTRLLTCNSAREATGTPTVQDMLTTSLGDKPVTGQAGFAYGMGKKRDVAVLKEEFEALYKADNFDATVGEHLTRIAHRTPKAATAIGYTPPKNLIKNQGEWKKVWRLFVGKMNAIQAALQRMVNETPGGDTLAKARALERDEAFQAKIGEQYALFAAFKLWRT